MPGSDRRLDHSSRAGWQEWGLNLAQAVATRADCTRRRVGAVLMTPDHSIVATGYNGGPPKGPSCLAGQCPRGQRSEVEVPAGSSYDTGPGACIALHAEQNALLRASWEQMRGGTLFVTDRPCDGCVRMIVGTPLDRVVWPSGVARVANGRFLHEPAMETFEFDSDRRLRI